MTTQIPLRPLDALQITVLMDNVTDVLALEQGPAKRVGLAASFATSLPQTATLTIAGSTTTTAAVNASAPFSTSAQAIPLTATVTSPGGTVNEGQVTFTILSGATTIAMPSPIAVRPGRTETAKGALGLPTASRK